MRPAIPLPKLTLAAALTTLLATGCPDGKDDPVDTGDSYVEIFDDDHDGYTTLEDCDDSDPDVHPGALEVCDGKDNDCDGLIDDDDDELRDPPTWYADVDADGYGDPGATRESCEPPSGYVDVEGDCDDTNPAIHPDAVELCDEIDNDCDELVDDEDDSVTDASTWYADSDDDGFGDPETSQQACELPSGFLADDGDCDDTDPEVNPHAEEICDNVDNDCDGDIDDADEDLAEAASWYLDSDGDGYGDPDTGLQACVQPSGYEADNRDCDDRDASVNPGATEICDAVDNDCDGDTDENDAADATTWYADSDGDGFGDAGSSRVACAAPTGFIADDRDCDDRDATIFPGADEYCDGEDDDCDGDIDEDDALDTLDQYEDRDGDGFGGALAGSWCEQLSAYVLDSSDCDDLDATVYPGADEYCDSIDSDCDGSIDDGDELDRSTWYADADADGYGDVSSTLLSCDLQSGYVADDTDCDDGDAAIHPAATEICDSVDNDCDGDIDDDDASLDTGTASTWYADRDGDGYGDAGSSTIACAQPSSTVADDRDCDDGDAAVHPAASEICDGIDNDCDGDVDDDDASLDTGTASAWYADRDGDGYGDAGSGTIACAQPSSAVADDADCDDGDAAIHPAATEICDSIDNDCDGDVDDDDASLDTGTASTWYADRDGDGYGDAGSSALACIVPSGFVADDSDCDDSDATYYPGTGGLCALGSSCDELLSLGYTGDGVYRIAPDGTGVGEHAFDAYCDQSTDGGGWTLLLSADGNSSYWGNNSSSWWAAGSDAAPSALTGADYHGPAYDQLPTDETRICYGDTAHCYSFVHGYGISLFDFFDGDITWTEYSYLSVGHSDVGTDSLRSDYLASLGLTAWTTSCYWLGINDTESISAIGLLGDSNGGCSHLGGTYPYHDDLAVGVGLQSCWDANGCANGGSGHLAGRSRGIGGVDNSGVYGPWFVFGR